jgi:hypothetical protein
MKIVEKLALLGSFSTFLNGPNCEPCGRRQL